MSNTEAFRRKPVGSNGDDDGEDEEGDYHEELDDYNVIKDCNSYF